MRLSSAPSVITTGSSPPRNEIVAAPHTALLTTIAKAPHAPDQA